MQTIKHNIFVIFILVLVVGCSKPKEGVVEYKITYDQTKEENPLVNLMPTTMKIYYNDQSILTQIEGWMGIFKSHQLSDLSDSTNVLLMKLLDKKYFFKRKMSEAPLSFENLNIVQMNYVNRDTVFKGYNCKQVLVDIMEDSVLMRYKLLYTEDIHIVSPNRNNPFYEIPGVLLNFKMNFKGMSMNLEFLSYRDTVFPENTFKIPDDYKELSREDMTKFFQELTSL